MSVPSTVAAAEAFRRGEFATIGAAAEAFGVTRSAVYKRLHPEKAQRWAAKQNAKRNGPKRDWENAHRATCSVCGGGMGAGTAKVDGSRSRTRTVGDVCATCLSKRRGDRALEMLRMRVEEDASNRAIARRLDTTVAAVANELSRLRAIGFDVPTSLGPGPPIKDGRRALDKHGVGLRNELARRGIEPGRVAA